MSACRGAARRRAQARKKLRDRAGADRVITPTCVDLCRERLEGIGIHLNYRGILELVWLLQRVLHTTRHGVSLPLRSFSSLGQGRKLLDGLMQAGLIWCPNPDSWKPHGYDIRNAKARRFLPTTDLLLANADIDIVASGEAYLSRRYGSRVIPTHSTVHLLPNGSTIPPHLIARLEEGTGLSFNLSSTIPQLAELSDEKRARILQAGQMALGCLGNRAPIHTEWIQKPTGRLYAKQPPIVNLPARLRRALQPIDRGIAGELDFQNFETRLLYAEAGVIAPPGDCAQFIGDQVGLAREDVKEVLNPLLHGQTEGNLIGTKQWHKLKNRRKLEAFLQAESPPVLQTIQGLQHEPFLLQRRGAEVFFSAYSKALKAEDIPAGIPLHDGLAFAATDESQLLRVKGIFEKVATEMLGQPMPMKSMIWN